MSKTNDSIAKAAAQTLHEKIHYYASCGRYVSRDELHIFFQTAIGDAVEEKQQRINELKSMLAASRCRRDDDVQE